MWLDKVAVRNILHLRDRFGIARFIETGSAEGTNALFYSHHFDEVHTCDVDPQLVEKARRRVRAGGVRLHQPNTWVYRQTSPSFLGLVRRKYEAGIWVNPPLFFLDAHTPGDWPILDELEALRDFPNCCIVIHDFKVPDPHLGHISYAGQDLDLPYVRERLFAINPRFHLYHNTRQLSDIWTPEEVRTELAGVMPWDDATRWQLDYAWSAPVKTYRGILYAVPAPLGPECEVAPWSLA